MQKRLVLAVDIGKEVLGPFGRCRIALRLMISVEAAWMLGYWRASSSR